MGFSRQKYWSGLPCLPPGHLPDSGIEPESLVSPALAGKFFTTSSIWENHDANLKCKHKNIQLICRITEIAQFIAHTCIQISFLGDCLFADRAGSYQRYQGKKLSDRFDAYSYYYLCGSVDSNNVGRGRGGVEKALGSIRTECTVIGIDSDRLFPVEEQKLIASCIPGAVYHEITSKFGHDGFLLENDQLTAIIQPLLP